MSMKNNGRRRRSGRSAAMHHELRRARRGHDHVGGGERLAEIVERHGLGRRSGRPARCAASRERLATNAISAPRDARFDAASSPIRPAPISSTRRPARSPKTWAARAAAADETDAGLSPIAVSLRTRLPTRERLAEDAVEQRAGLDRLERRPHLAEDLALARHERVEPGRDAEEVQRGRVVVQAVEHAVERLAGELARAPRAARVLRRRRRGTARSGCRSRGRRPRRASGRGRRAAAGRARRARATRPARRDARGRRASVSCEVASGEREPRDDHEREAAEREVGGAPTGRAKHEEATVDEPGQRPSAPRARRVEPPLLRAGGRGRQPARA